MDPSTDVVPSVLMRGILKKDNRHAAPVITRTVAGGVSDKQVIVIERLKQSGRLAQIDVRMIHATGTDPSGLGMSSPRGAPNRLS